MAALATKMMGGVNEGHSSVYPLFHKGAKPREPCIENAGPVASNNYPSQCPPSAISKQSNQKNWEPKATDSGSGQQSQSELENARLNRKEHVELLDVDPNNGRRKRRKTASPEAKELPGDTREQQSVHQLPGPAEMLGTSSKPKEILVTPMHNEDSVTSTEAKVPSKPKNESPLKNGSTIMLNENGPESSFPLLPLEPSEPAKASLPTPLTVPLSTSFVENYDKPKKLLKLNPKTGTIGSPPAKKPAPVRQAQTRKQQIGSSLVVIRYSSGSRLPHEIGYRIEQIMKGTQTAALQSKMAPNSAKPSQTLPKVTKSIHPLFLGKPAVKAVNLQQIPTEEPDTRQDGPKEKSTIGKPQDRSHVRQKSPSRPSLNAFANSGGPAKPLKFPGAINPAWPWQGMVHTRGHANALQAITSDEISKVVARVPGGKRGKFPAVQVQSQENVIHGLASALAISGVVKDIQEVNLDDFPPLPNSLRVPKKRHETGTQLQQEIQKQLYHRLFAPSPVEPGEDGALSHEPSRSRVHPALTRMYNLLATSLSAFDQGQCETQTWTQKYSPSSATDVLQVGREAVILKEWMQTLIVQSVEVRGGDGTSSRASSLSRGSSKLDFNGKRKRKSKKLDGFVISSDEETDDLDEISEPEDFVSPPGSQGNLKRTLVTSRARSSKEPGKFRNTVLISGPHGCGKSASVYAVAKELDFEIFEINSSSRRSGKDIMEKVGNMTQNHLVQQHNVPARDEDEDSQRIDEALDNDIRSGRQGTMNSFFKPQQPSALRSSENNPVKPPKTLNSAKDKVLPKKPTKRQKQSLILIEEVDVIYEEDKQFWATVMALIAQSKRPIIMTCNDESLIPMLPLHAIIRFNPPPVDLAVDYMLLTSACEGHILDRDAVRSLYESRNMDLRASLTELNYWCQFAVGDQKHGLGWFYRRVAGSNADKNHNQVRVVSESTYQTGMGWYSNDLIESRINPLDLEEHLLHETWDGWQLDAGNWQVNLPLSDWAESLNKSANKDTSKLAALQIYENFAETMSLVDLCSGSTFAPEFQVHIDSSLPELTQKARDDYVIAFPLLEASSVNRPNELGKDMAIWMKSHCRNFLQVDQHVKHSLDVHDELGQRNQGDIIRLIRDRIYKSETSLSRHDLSLAFDPISEPEKSSLHSSGHLEASCFDRTKAIITQDIAPYVRSIVAYDARLQQDRNRLSNLMSEGGRKGKRLRTTRAAISALEGGARSTTRPERYFNSELNPNFVLRTGNPSWLEAVAAGWGDAPETDGSRRSSLADTNGDGNGIVREDEDIADI